MSACDESLLVLSRATETTYFFSLTTASRRKYVLALPLFPVSVTFFYIYLLTFDNNDSQRHISHGNMLYIFTTNADIFSLATVMTYMQLSLTQMQSLYFCTQRPETIAFVASYIRQSFCGLKTATKNFLASCIKFILFSSLGIAVFTSLYAGLQTLQRYETNLSSKISVLLVSVFIATSGFIYMRALGTQAACMYLATRSLNNEINLIREELNQIHIASLINGVNRLNKLLSVVRKLNDYWKVMLFFTTLFNAIVISSLTSIMLFSQSDLPFKIAVVIAIIGIFFCNTVFILMFALVDANIKSLHKVLLLAIRKARYSRIRRRLRNFLFMFENLKLFTFCDITSVTYDSYVKVSFMFFMRRSS